MCFEPVCPRKERDPCIGLTTYMIMGYHYHLLGWPTDEVRLHIAEGYLPVSHCLGWTIASAPFAAASVRTITKSTREKPEQRVLLAASGAFVFALTALRLPSVTGSSSHPTGTAVGTCILTPAPMPAMALIVLLFQALLLAHGGITTLGANLFSLGVAGPWAAWVFFRLGRGLGLNDNVSVFAASVTGDLATYVTTAGQLALAFPSGQGGYLASFEKFLGIFLVTQIPIAIAEGFLSVAVVRALSALNKPAWRLSRSVVVER